MNVYYATKSVHVPGGITCRFRMGLLQCNALFPFLFKKNHDTLVQKKINKTSHHI